MTALGTSSDLLTMAEVAAMLDTDATVIRRMEMEPDKNSYRSPAPRMVRLMAAYIAGYRPPDWPATDAR